MIIQNFRSSADDEVGGQADAGRGKLALVPNDRPSMPLARICRDTRSTAIGEQHLLTMCLAVEFWLSAFARVNRQLLYR